MNWHIILGFLFFGFLFFYFLFSFSQNKKYELTMISSIGRTTLKPSSSSLSFSQRKTNLNHNRNNNNTNFFSKNEFFTTTKILNEQQKRFNSTNGRMKNQVTVVTGSGSGIGEGIAKKYGAEGAKVVVADLNIEAAEKVAKSINENKNHYGGEAIAAHIDVTQEESVNKAMDLAVHKFGSLDNIVANAGVQHIEAVHNLSLDNWRKVMAIHLDGSFLCTKAALKHMYAAQDDQGLHKGGSIIYIGSVHSKTASVLKAPYVSAKHGLLGLCRTVAKEGAPYHVRSNVICPGFVKTPLVEKQIPEQAQSLGMSEEDVIKKVMLKDTVNGEFVSVDDIAETSVFLAAAKSNSLTGQSIVVSNGWHME
eukprot:gb/GECH01010813.1/.p1 GENE.gb/GECH01010813.1/~~gb/GECH01010813.1/.p1  ORF type:complete len:364 (+),score=91.81 gb/GECH01010813.1/:1-1092(+)